MFWNKKNKGFKDGGVVEMEHEAYKMLVQYTDKAIDERLNKKMETFREQVIKKDDKIIDRVEKLEAIVKALCPCKDVDIAEVKQSKEDHESVGIFDVIMPAARSKEVALENIKKKNRLLYGCWDWTPYTKTCTLCGEVEFISKKEYLTYQKETIESSLKECEANV
jgi:hypothetical protein